MSINTSMMQLNEMNTSTKFSYNVSCWICFALFTHSKNQIDSFEDKHYCSTECIN